MITGRQIRAARALIDMSQDELAAAAGLTPQAIRKIENGDVTPREGTIADILTVFDSRDVEFFQERGVALKDEAIVTLVGENVFPRLLEDVIKSEKGNPNAEVLFSCVKDSVSPQIVINQYRQLRKARIKMRSLVEAGDTYLMGSLDEYRYIPSENFHNNATLIYGEKFATMILDLKTGKDTGAVIIRNKHIATAQRNMFNLIWNSGEKPMISTAKEKYDD